MLPKSAENPMDSKFEFWGDLPVEMRMECIKKMDFKTRMQLRATSKQDKLLVESAPKYHFDVVNFLFYDFEGPIPTHLFLPVTSSYETGEEATIEVLSGASLEYNEKTYQFAAQVIKFSTAYNLFSNADAKSFNDSSKFLADISNLDPLIFKTLIIESNWFEVVEFFLKNYNNHVESITLECSRDFGRQKLLEFVTYPSVINAKEIHFIGLDNVEVPYQLIKKWLEKEDLEVGKEVYIITSNFQMIYILAERFASRKISDNSVKWMLISTNNPTKAIKISLRGLPASVDPAPLVRIKVVKFDRNEQIGDNLNLGALGAALPNV